MELLSLMLYCYVIHDNGVSDCLVV